MGDYQADEVVDDDIAPAADDSQGEADEHDHEND